jgi:hypothetical protein
MKFIYPVSPAVTIRTADFNTKKSAFRPQSVFYVFLVILTISNAKRLVFLTETPCAFCEV